MCISQYSLLSVKYCKYRQCYYISDNSYNISRLNRKNHFTCPEKRSVPGLTTLRLEQQMADWQETEPGHDCPS
jgi:hypothetical protein